MASAQREMFSTSVVDEDERLVHWCRMGLLAVGILHWIVFYLLTQGGASEMSNSVAVAGSSLCRLYR